ncbi:LysR family transcriptional regulator [Sphaerisporangium melleum]|uniref:LysR family transcriptional regulator n=1 Tax=Sphaerisporangium melleum TaxID=321316 RepID=A0A917R967_9ACTN|nr:LysR substrate-binding domain-containing protein [Sphaerisporangium melleum]GGK95632.1 LysR family transcriptional regulator [Sphaerisporangium melleum]GII70621.1 LysR family transcriptional regulator [Sphaerisporangium melleum]
MDLDLRKLRYFAEVAEQLHFGRAAERLHVSQPVLSRQISRLEREIGTPLLERSSRQVTLTAAGRQLLEETRTLLAASAAARERVRAAGQGTPVLTLGFMAGIPINPVICAFQAAHPGVTVELRRLDWYDQAELILDGSVDLAYVRPPLVERGLRLRPLYAEPRFAVLPAGHRLAGAPSLRIMDLAGDPVVMHRDAIPAWDAFCNTDPRPDGRHPIAGPVIRSMDEKLEHVAAGRAITFLPASAATHYARPDTVAVPVTDIPPHPVCLAWSAIRGSALIDRFAAIAARHVPDLPGGATAAVNASALED